MAFYGRRRVAGPLFAYLDAHWYSDLPLGDELDIIHSACRGAVVMIDNFQVPDDPGYAFDDCGPGRTLRAYIESRIDRFGLTPLYPTLRSADETGARRGCVVLVNDRQWGAAFRNIGELRF